MGTKTKIEWTDATWNPILGCSRVSEGCRNCYAEKMAGRFGGGKETVYSGLTKIVNGRAVWTGKIKETKKLLEPLSWRSPKRIFVNSMSDLFHESVPDGWIDKIFAVMALCPQHIFQVLTKRPENMLRWFTKHHSICRPGAREMVFGYVQKIPGYSSTDSKWMTKAANAFDLWPLPNVWLGVSVENQVTAEDRIPLLLQTPAALRFISAEPLLGPVDLWKVNVPARWSPECGQYAGWDWHDFNGETPGGLDWVICGGESGPGARPMHPNWARSLRDQCASAKVPFFFKQWGSWLPPSTDGGLDRSGAQVLNASDDFVRVGKHAAGSLLDGVKHKAFPAVRP